MTASSYIIFTYKAITILINIYSSYQSNSSYQSFSNIICLESARDDLCKDKKYQMLPKSGTTDNYY